MKKIDYLWLFVSLALLACLTPLRAELDGNANQQSDVWEMWYNAVGLGASVDTDGDGFTNLRESLAATDPRDPESRPRQAIEMQAPDSAMVRWPSAPGKMYRVDFSTTLGNLTSPWQTVNSRRGNGAENSFSYPLPSSPSGFFRIEISDMDTDLDGVSDWEELAVGFNPNRPDTDRYSWLATNATQTVPARSADYNRIKSGLSATSVISVVVVDSDVTIGWPDPGIISIKRTGGLGRITVPITLSGTAVRGADYTSSIGTSVTFPVGVREIPIEFSPVGSSTITAERTIIVTASVGTGQVTLKPRPAGDKPSAKAAVRFLLQASFGADDAELASVQALGFEGWIDNQLTRPLNLQQAAMAEFDNQLRIDFPGQVPELRAYGDDYPVIWWETVMKSGATSDPLRQRIAYALSQTLVISGQVDAINFYPVSMSNYYDMLLRNSFGNYRDLLFQMTLHPCMGTYLSHLRNAKEDPSKNLFPDENFAREILQLFSIGLWQLNPDGTRVLNGSGQPIPTYTNNDIRNFAKVFTGLTLKKEGLSQDPAVRTADYFEWTDNYTYSGTMEMWDQENWVYKPSQPWQTSANNYHDRTVKTLLNGTVLPANQRGLKDIADAIDNIMAHPNVGPFICRQLIQRLVTSNPSPAYIARVGNVFTAQKANPNQLAWVIKAILLDRDARDHSKLSDVTFGKPREPYMRIANLLKAFKASAPNGRFFLRGLHESLGYAPMRSPSVFNFYLPDHRPAGVLSQAGLYAPEFQIMTDVAAISYPNYVHYGLISWRRWTNNQPTNEWVKSNFNSWGSYYPSGHPKSNTDIVTPDQSAEVALASDPAALLRRLDLWMTYGNLSAANHQLIREALERITQGNHGPAAYPGDYLIRRADQAIYMIANTPEFNILK